MKAFPSSGLVRDRLLRSASGLASAASRARAAAPEADDVIEWARRQQERVSANLPSAEDLEGWVRENAARLGCVERTRREELEHLERVLNGVVAAIRQLSDRRARILTNTVIAKLGGAAAIGGITGLITAFGTASTGTAIASLYGAAATTAQLYWVGSLVGLGTAAGGVMLAATGVGLGVAAAYAARSYLFGSGREADDLQDHEKAILTSCVALLGGLRGTLDTAEEMPSDAEMRIVAEQALLPLACQIAHYRDRSSMEPDAPNRRPFSETLSPANRWKLDRCRREIERAALAAMARTVAS